MTEREKLLELLYECVGESVEVESDDWSAWTEINYDKIADHLLSNGVIVPPCKVGDTVYFIYETYDEEGINRCILECKVEQVGVDSKSAWFQLKLPLGVKLSGYFRDNNIGKTVFRSRKGAEKALKERKEQK